MQISEEQAQEVTLHERRIEQTRLAMGDTVSQLQHQLSPGTLAGSAGNAVKEATVGRSGQLISTLTDRVKANPIPAALAGASLAWIWMSGRNDGRKTSGYSSSRGLTSTDRPVAGRMGEQISSGASDLANQVSSRVGETAGQVSSAVDDVAESARTGVDQLGMQAQRVQTSFQRMLEENPLPIALAAAGLGALIASAVPTSGAEQRMLEPVGQQLSDQARKVGDKVSQVAQRAQSAVREEVERQ